MRALISAACVLWATALPLSHAADAKRSERGPSGALDARESPAANAAPAKTLPPEAKADAKAFSFAVFWNAWGRHDSLGAMEDEAAAFSAPMRDAGAAFAVQLGSLLPPDAQCTDTNRAMQYHGLQHFEVPLIYLPAAGDWLDCRRTARGGYDPVERLDALRSMLYASNRSLGQPPMLLARQSEVAGYRPYRENMRWTYEDVVFITLHVTGENNNFVNGGGRNGEYEDRTVANRFWLDRAAAYVRLRAARALVVLIAADASLDEKRGARWNWWHPQRSRQRDGYAAFRRDLLAGIEGLGVPALLIYRDDASRDAPKVEVVAIPARSGKPVAKVLGIGIEGSPAGQELRWTRIEVGAGRTPSVHADPMHAHPVGTSLGAPGATAGAAQARPAQVEQGVNGTQETGGGNGAIETGNPAAATSSGVMPRETSPSPDSALEGLTPPKLLPLAPLEGWQGGPRRETPPR